jgi:Protein of unknown function (DUF3102)
MKNLDGDGSSAYAESEVVPPQDDGQIISHCNVSSILRALAEGGIDRGTLIGKIKELHADVDGSVLDCWRKNLPKMIQLGAELTALKDDVGHGKWLKWFRDNDGLLGFSVDTAENYMRLYRNQDLFERSNSMHVRNLTDALILIKEPDPAKRKALLEYAARNGKSIRTAKKNRQMPSTAPDAPAQRSRDLRQEAVECFYRQWTRNNDSRTTLRDREGFEWVDKVPVTQGETALTIGKEAFRLFQESLSGAAPALPPEDTPAEPQETPTGDSDDNSTAEPEGPVEQTQTAWKASPEEASKAKEAYAAKVKQDREVAFKAYLDSIYPMLLSDHSLSTFELEFEQFYRYFKDKAFHFLGPVNWTLLHEFIKQQTESKYS